MFVQFPDNSLVRVSAVAKWQLHTFYTSDHLGTVLDSKLGQHPISKAPCEFLRVEFYKTLKMYLTATVGKEVYSSSNIELLRVKHTTMAPSHRFRAKTLNEVYWDNDGQGIGFNAHDKAARLRENQVIGDIIHPNTTNSWLDMVLQETGDALRLAAKNSKNMQIDAWLKGFNPSALNICQQFFGQDEVPSTTVDWLDAPATWMVIPRSPLDLPADFGTVTRGR